MDDLGPGKLVVAVLAAGRKYVSRTEGTRKTEHGQDAQGIEG